MVRRFIDISVPLQNDVAADPPGVGPRIEYIDHQQSLPQVLPFFPGLKKEDLPDGQGWAVERVELSTHNGTHLDAPWHYHPTMNGGERAWTIDDVPLEWCFQNGVKLDFRHFADGYVATAADVDAELTRIGHALEPLDIVLVNRPGDRNRRLELGRAVRSHRQAASPRPMIRRSSGRATRRDATSVIATSRNCTTSRRCRRPDSLSPAFR